jgi:hypothetical protein
MAFKRSTLRYGETPEPVTPYQKAAQVWDERIGSARVQAHNWRLMALGSLGLSLILAAILLWVGRSGSTVPYIVEVDSLGAAPSDSDRDLPAERRPERPGLGDQRVDRTVEIGEVVNWPTNGRRTRRTMRTRDVAPLASEGSARAFRGCCSRAAN